MLFAVLFSAMALIAGVFGVGLGLRAVDESNDRVETGGAAAEAAPTTATVHLSEFAISPASVEIATGGTLSVHNDGAATHNVAVEGTDLITPMSMMLDDAGTIGFSLNGKSFPATAPVVASQGEWIQVHYLNRA